MAPNVIGKMNEGGIVIVDRIAAGVLVDEEAVAEKEVAKDQRAYQHENTCDEENRKPFQKLKATIAERPAGFVGREVKANRMSSAVVALVQGELDGTLRCLYRIG